MTSLATTEPIYIYIYIYKTHNIIKKKFCAVNKHVNDSNNKLNIDKYNNKNLPGDVF